MEGGISPFLKTRPLILSYHGIPCKYTFSAKANCLHCKQYSRLVLDDSIIKVLRGVHTFHYIWRTLRPLDYERVYLPLYKVADTPFHIQGEDLCSAVSVLGQPTMLYQYRNSIGYLIIPCSIQNIGLLHEIQDRYMTNFLLITIISATIRADSLIQVLPLSRVEIVSAKSQRRLIEKNIQGVGPLSLGYRFVKKNVKMRTTSRNPMHIPLIWFYHKSTLKHKSLACYQKW